MCNIVSFGIVVIKIQERLCCWIRGLLGPEINGKENHHIGCVPCIVVQSLKNSSNHLNVGCEEDNKIINVELDSITFNRQYKPAPRLKCLIKSTKIVFFNFEPNGSTV